MSLIIFDLLKTNVANNIVYVAISEKYNIFERKSKKGSRWKMCNFVPIFKIAIITTR